jgi:hypothetical protein
MNLLLLACYFKGERFMKQAHARGAKVHLLTQERLRDKPWPHESLDGFFAQMNDPPLRATINTVTYMMRNIRFDRVVGLDDFDVETAAALREHLRLPGMGESQARYFRDKLACRFECRRLGIPVPDFTGVFNNDEVAEFIARVPAPWMLKPRSEASATGIHKVESAEDLWKLLDAKGDQRSFFLLEQYLPGDVYHADSLTNEGKVVFAETHRCLTPPFNVAHGGGIFASVTLPRGGEEERELRALNEKVLTGLGMQRGASHVEFIKGREDGRFYLLETAARVGGAHIAEQVEASTGLNLWEQWANLEIDGPAYQVPAHREEYGGLLMTLSKQEHPDLSAFEGPELFYKAPEAWHAGMVLRTSSHERLMELVQGYGDRLKADYNAFLPAPTKATH